jgi:uncharacterized protein YkwD
MSSLTHRRTSAMIIATVAALAVTTTLTVSSATAAGARPRGPTGSVTTAEPAEQTLLRWINDTRAVIGVGPVVVDGYLDAYARGHAVAMAQAGQLFHSDIGSLLGPYGAVVENVAYASDAASAHAAFLASGFHYENIVDPGSHRVGIGLQAGGPWMFAVYVFAD